MLIYTRFLGEIEKNDYQSNHYFLDVSLCWFLHFSCCIKETWRGQVKVATKATIKVSRKGFEDCEKHFHSWSEDTLHHRTSSITTTINSQKSKSQENSRDKSLLSCFSFNFSTCLLVFNLHWISRHDQICSS